MYRLPAAENGIQLSLNSAQSYYLNYALNTLFSEPIATQLESCKKEKRTYSMTKRQKYKLKKKTNYKIPLYECVKLSVSKRIWNEKL